MTIKAPLIHCINPHCSRPLNPIYSELCDNCRTPLVYRYLWAVGQDVKNITLGELVQARYLVIKSQIWLDTRPDLPPDSPDSPTQDMTPYLFLYGQYWHIPQVHGHCQLVNENNTTEILLLDNVPLDPDGNLIPSLRENWHKANSVRQVYWIWQILELWKLFTELNVELSLLNPENIRVDGWRVRICQLYSDTESKNLQDLGSCLQEWVGYKESKIEKELKAIFQQMKNGENINDITGNINTLLLEQAANTHLRLRIVGATDKGAIAEHNEDNCYPRDLDFSPEDDEDIARKHFAIVCDGIEGHEGGEVASQLAVQSIKLQVKALIKEVEEQEEIMMPDLVADQLSAIIRVANNLIASRNDQQGRESRKRMATTLVMAVQLPQRIITPNQVGNSHELYIAHIGDSRAYWLTPNYCLKLTLDDDITTREIKLGNSLYNQAIQRPDGTALTQALGTKDAEFIRPNVKRLILEEDGLLLLCSDGLSDNNWVEKTWKNYTKSVLDGQISLESAVKSLINLANEKNGNDNISVVLSYCRVSPEYPILVIKDKYPQPEEMTFLPVLIPDIPTLEDVEVVDAEVTSVRKSGKLKILLIILSLLLLLLGGSGIGLYIWWLNSPVQVQQLKNKVLRKIKSISNQ